MPNTTFKPDFLEKHPSERNIIDLANHIIEYAISLGASDIHFEPNELSCRIRFRIDGILQAITQFPGHFTAKLTSRLKILAQLDIAEKRLPQDGRIHFQSTLSKQAYDIRISTCPGLFGEKSVLRLLKDYQQLLSLDQLGLSKAQRTLLDQTLQSPHGLILITGPTGSGKTLSLYSMLSAVTDEQRSICSVEDPVEMHLPHIHQVSVNSKARLTFSKTLRAFLRQDPDIILVGEIRDAETAETCIKAAQTGHLVLSTLHTNSAALTLNRLINMGVADYQLANATKLIIAQRLLRKLCPHCKQPDNHNPAYLNDPLLPTHDEESIYQAIGCKHCHQGYQGRIGIFELLPIGPAIQTAILTRKSAADIQRIAIQSGMISLRQAALALVCSGQTALAEANRVTILEPTDS